MRIVLTLAVGVGIGLASWATNSIDVAGRETVGEVVEQSVVTEEGCAFTECLARPGLLAAAPSRPRRTVVADTREPLCPGTVLPSGHGGPVFDANCVDVGEPNLDVVVGFQRIVLASVSDFRTPPSSGTERRGYDRSQCAEFNFDDPGCDSFGLQLIQDAALDAVRPLAWWGTDGPVGGSRIERLPRWVPAGAAVFNATSESLDAWERELDERMFAGGRDLTLDVVRLDDPTTCLADFGLLLPRAGTSTAISVVMAEAVIRRARGSTSVTLDVPEDRAVFGFAGRSCAYVADYDVEVGQGLICLDPIYRTADAGLGVSARVIGRPDGGVNLILDARWVASLPEFRMFNPSYEGGPISPCPADVRLESPTAEEAASEFQGLVSIGTGDAGALVGLSSGEVLVIIPRGPVRDATHARTWRSVDLTERPSGEPVRPPVSEAIQVDWSFVDVDPSGQNRMATLIAVGEAGVVPHPGQLRDVDLRSLASPGSVYVVPGPVLDCRRIDVVVRLSNPLSPGSRSFQVLHTDGTTTTVELPRVSRAVIPLRFVLRDGETAARDVTLDRGGGPETWRVAVSRRIERSP